MSMRRRLLIRWYEDGYLRQESMPEALRLAKLGFLRADVPGQRLPWHWAPFVLVGDSGP